MAVQATSEGFFAYARERETIRRKRLAGEPAPWTDDWVLRTWRFCNVHREHDRVTEWFREHVRWPLDQEESEELVFAVTLFRWFNLVSVGEILLRERLFHEWDHRVLREAMVGVKPITTAAFMVKTPVGLAKVEGIIVCLEQFRALGLEHETRMAAPAGLQAMHSVLMKCPFLGKFMAYEIVTDLRWTSLGRHAPDILTWANPGPGAMRGLDRLHGDELETRGRKMKTYETQMQEEMQELLALSQQASNWPQEWDPWEMRTVEHTLCEYDKYLRAWNGDGVPKQRYRKGTGPRAGAPT